MNIKDKILNSIPIKTIKITRDVVLIQAYRGGDCPFILHIMGNKSFSSNVINKYQAHDIVAFMEFCGINMTDLKYYSDDARHLVCTPYSIENLHTMAANLGIKRCWFHNSKHPHYDIPKRRIAEIQAKTTVVSSNTILNIIKCLHMD